MGTQTKFSRKAFIEQIDGYSEPIENDLHIENDEAAAWIASEPGVDVPFFNTLLGGLGVNVSPVDMAKLDRLIAALLGDPTVDQMCELRDQLRAILIDCARSEIVPTTLAVRRFRMDREERAYWDERLDDRYAVAR